MSEKLEKNLEQTASKKMRLLKLFWSTLYLSAFTFGGGYVIVSLMKNEITEMITNGGIIVPAIAAITPIIPSSL